MPVGIQKYYTTYGDDRKIRDLAVSITEGRSGYYDKVKAIVDYLKNNYLYSLKPGIATDGNQLHHFLFESKKGYCSYFAFAMALMCRSLGIPARVSVGFYVDPKMEVLNFYEVRAFQAHAWVEVYFGDLGWISFDPTSERPAPGEQFTFYMGPDMDRMSKLIGEILANQNSLSEEQNNASQQQTLRSLGIRLTRVFWLLARLWYFTLPALYLLYLTCVKLVPSLPGLLLADRRRKARGLYRLALVKLHGRGIRRGRSESFLEFAGRVQRHHKIAAEDLTAYFLKAVFAPRFERADMESFQEARREFARTYRESLGLPLRVIAIFASLGGAPTMISMLSSKGVAPRNGSSPVAI